MGSDAVGERTTGRGCHPFDLIARVLAARLQGGDTSAELRAIVRSRKVDWERVVGLARWAGGPLDWQVAGARFATAGHRRPFLAFVPGLRDGALCAAAPPGKIAVMTTLQERRIAWQARSRTVAHIGFWPIWCVALLRIQIEEREGGRRKLVNTLSRFLYEQGAGQRMLRTLIYGARPWMLLLLSPALCR